MKVCVEVESKLELDFCGFNLLLSSGEMVRKVDQLNIYYDQSWQLADQSSTFRVRFARSESPRVTLKDAQVWEGGRRTTREIEASLYELGFGQFKPPKQIEVLHLPRELSEPLMSHGISTLIRVGWVRNHRYVIQMHGYGMIELDCLKLPDGRNFFEVEIEEENTFLHQRLVEHVRSIVPNAQRSTLSKFERFRAAVVNSGYR